jgi:hypothetical protein
MTCPDWLRSLQFLAKEALHNVCPSRSCAVVSLFLAWSWSTWNAHLWASRSRSRQGWLAGLHSGIVQPGSGWWQVQLEGRWSNSARLLAAGLQLAPPRNLLSGLGNQGAVSPANWTGQSGCTAARTVRKQLADDARQDGQVDRADWIVVWWQRLSRAYGCQTPNAIGRSAYSRHPWTARVVCRLSALPDL